MKQELEQEAEANVAGPSAAAQTCERGCLEKARGHEKLELD